MDLRGRVALVTGGAGGIGSAAADAIAELGGSVAILDLAPNRCEEAAARIADLHGVETVGVPIDLEVEDEVRRSVSLVEQRFGRLDILIHCAALVGTSGLEGWAVPFSEQKSDTWRRALEINLTAPFILTQEAAPLLKASGSGSVIMVGSIYGVAGPDWSLYEGSGLGNPAAYAASKGGLLQLTRWLATTLAPEARVNSVSPGGVYRGHTDPFLSRYTRKVPLGRMASEEDLKGAIAYLASDASLYVTGAQLIVDGGVTVM